MKKNLYIDIHALHTLPPSNVNRDETGSPKSAVFGGVNRARVSSQSWKKAVRNYFRDNSINPDDSAGIRSRRIAELIAEEIISIDPEHDYEEAYSKAVNALGWIGVKVNKKNKKESDVLAFLSKKHIQALAEISLMGMDENERKSRVKSVVNRNLSYDLALFGRMVASEAGFNIEAACQFAHALGIHAMTPEFDFWTATDDLGRADDAGAGNLGVFEFNSSTYYRFASVNLGILQDNLGSLEAVIEAVKIFVEAFINSVPSGKQNSFAAKTIPSSVIVNVSNVPVSYANAFETPVERTRYSSVSEVGYEKMVNHAVQMKDSYGITPTKSWSITGSDSVINNSERTNIQGVLEGLSEYLGEVIEKGDDE